MRVIKSEEIKNQQWLDFYANNPFATPFQSPEYFDFFNEITGLAAEAFAVIDDIGIAALCVVTLQKEKGIKGYFSRRAIIYGGPLIAEGDRGGRALKILLDEINTNLKSKVIYAEIRNLHDYSFFAKIFKETGWDFLPHLNFHLDCSSEATVWQNLNTNRSRQIKKALKAGVIVSEATNLDEVSVFYDILQDLYRNKIKKPLFPFEFFRKFFENKMGKYLLVRYKGEIIGGIQCPVLEDKVIYEFYICGKDQEYKEASPSVMATYAAINFGVKNNLKYFDFMGAGKPDEDYGVRDFKSKFGGAQVSHGRFIRISSPFLFALGKMALAILKKVRK